MKKFITLIIIFINILSFIFICCYRIIPYLLSPPEYSYYVRNLNMTFIDGLGILFLLTATILLIWQLYKSKLMSKSGLIMSAIFYGLIYLLTPQYRILSQEGFEEPKYKQLIQYRISKDDTIKYYKWINSEGEEKPSAYWILDSTAVIHETELEFYKKRMPGLFRKSENNKKVQE